MILVKNEDNVLVQSILDSMQEGVEIVDTSGKIVFLNTAFSKISGIKSEDRLGKNIFKVHPNGALAKVLNTKCPLTYVKAFSEETGIFALSNISPIYRDGTLVGAILVCQDVSEVINLSRKLTEQTLLTDSLYKKIGEASYTLDDIIGESKGIIETKNIIKRLASTDVSIFIEGETGTGKELFAHAVHKLSPRYNKPFIQVNCAAIPEGLQESEMFGYERGAFTGASSERKGMFELANNGTLFLDEIGEMCEPLQAKLLRVLQSNELRRIGGSEIIKVNVRVVSATNRNLNEMLINGSFRKDLYYRLNIVPVRIPPLRDRKEDIPSLIELLIEKSCKRFGRPTLKIDSQALSLLQQHDWPGNVRELENVIQYGVLICTGLTIKKENIIPKLPLYKNNCLNNGIQSLDEMEINAIKKSLDLYGYSSEGKKKAAETLGISISTLYNKVKKFGIRAEPACQDYLAP